MTNTNKDINDIIFIIFHKCLLPKLLEGCCCFSCCAMEIQCLTADNVAI